MATVGQTGRGCSGSGRRRRLFGGAAGDDKSGKMVRHRAPYYLDAISILDRDPDKELQIEKSSVLVFNIVQMGAGD